MNRRGFLQSMATAVLHPSRQLPFGLVPHGSTSGQDLVLDAVDRVLLPYRLVGIVAPIVDTDRVVLVSHTAMGSEIRVRTGGKPFRDTEWKRRDEEEVTVPVRGFTIWTSGRTRCYQTLSGGPSGWTAQLTFEVPVHLGIYVWERRRTETVALVELAPSPARMLYTAAKEA